ncbi:hypothetical protein GCM10010435_78950 [Winogradskya consettensis]
MAPCALADVWVITIAPVAARTAAAAYTMNLLRTFMGVCSFQLRAQVVAGTVAAPVPVRPKVVVAFAARVPL